MSESPAERYLELGLRVGRHVEGIVDAYFGPPELAAAIDAAPLVEPRTLVADAETLLGELEDGWLRDQVAGLHTYAGVLAGDTVSYADEVEQCYGVRPTHTDESVFEEAHAHLEELLPGEGKLAERYERWRTSMVVPAEQIEPLVAAVMAEGRAWTRGLLDLPAGEGVELEIVRNEPWMGFCYYLGGLQSRISVNVDLPKSASEVLHLTMHETYPGHHAERCAKEQVLVLGRGLLEETIVLVPTPQSIVAEGIAELAPAMVLESDTGRAIAEIVQDAGIEFDLARALAIERAGQPLRWAEVNGALLLHDAGAGKAETQAYLERWGLMTAELATHLIRFLNEPTSRSYMITYAAGRDVCGAWVAGDPERFRRLLTEQVRVGELLDAR